MSCIRIVFVIIALVLLSTPILKSDQEKYLSVKVFFDSRSEYLELREMALDRVAFYDDHIVLVITQSRLAELTALGLRTEIIHDDLAAFYRSRLPRDRDMGGYRTLDEIYAHVDSLIADHPDIVSAPVSLGQTVEGRDIRAVKISDNPGLDEDEPEILYTAAIHAREVITPEVLLYFMDHLTDSYGVIPEVTDLVDNREMWFVTVVNPDGYYYNEATYPGGGGMWRKNRRDNGDGSFGVDLNRNYGYQWGYDDEGSSPITSYPTYRGPAPFSEPETQAMRDFIIGREFIITIYYHSHANCILYPWSYDNLHTVDHDIFSAIGDTISDFNGYIPGTPMDALNYPANGSSDDWGYGEQALKDKNFAFTMEVGNEDDGFWPPVHRIPQLIAENLQPNLFLARIAGNIYSLRAPEQPVLVIDDTVDAALYDVVWTFDDTLNPALSFELMEMQGYVHGHVDSADDFDLWRSDGFGVVATRRHSAPYSFFSGSDDLLTNRMETDNPVAIEVGDSLRFWIYYDIEEDWDYGYVEVSLDGIAYETLPGNITTTDNPHGNNRGHGITGFSGGWTEALFDLSDFSGRAIFFRFSYETDEYVTEEGLYIDDISPLDIFASQDTLASGIVDTFYTVSDRPEGAYYYKVRARDAENQYGLFSAVESLVAVETFICGDVNADETINIMDITYLINYLYRDGPAPLPSEAADVDNSGEINLLDITGLIEFLYMAGPEPECP